jgi:hypothetical protein
MAQKFLVNIDLVQNQIINGQFESLASDPSTGNFEGRLIYNSTEKTIKVYTGSAWRKMIHAVSSNTTALTVSESSGAISLTVADVVAGGASGLISGADKTKLDSATSVDTPSTLALRDSSGRIQVAAPSADKDAANKGYVDAIRTGLDVKDSVRAATTGDINLTGTQTIDGVTLVEGDRVLVKNQDTASENGIWVVASGAWSRSSDADQDFEVTPGMFTFVEEGTVNANSGWVLTTNGSITVGTTSLSFVQFSGAGQVVAGDGLTKTGNQLDVGGTADRITVTADAVDIATTYAGQTSITTLGTITTGTWNGTTIAVADGGTGATTAAGARDNLAATTAGTTSTPTLARVASQVIGDGTSTSYTVTHNFGTRDVIVQVYDLTSYETVVTEVVRTNNDSISVIFSSAPLSNSYKVVVTG